MATLLGAMALDSTRAYRLRSREGQTSRGWIVE